VALTGSRTFVNFGFGAIGAGLMLYEAFESGNFARLVVAEVVPEIVKALRAAGGFYSVNIARADRVDVARVGPIEVLNPREGGDRAKLIAAITEAEEIATAVPSVDFYTLEGEGSLHRVLAAGLAAKVEKGGPRAVVYAAENDNGAAEKLEKVIVGELPAKPRAGLCDHVQFLNTVIGKMSGLVGEESGLAPVTPKSPRAFLVEEFNRILVSAPGFGEPFERGIPVFAEKSELLPFEEAKLYGHNATHALAAYLGAELGAATIGELREIPGFVEFLRAAFIEESGAALTKKHAGVDALFTEDGYQAYADDLLARMTNPHLGDTVERVGRDPRRKLGWHDRLVGTIRVALSQGVRPQRYALGAAAGFAMLNTDALVGAESLEKLARSTWEDAGPEAEEVAAVLEVLEEGREIFTLWRAAGHPDLPTFLSSNGD
jgi:mannitol-1-phosphate 5-dehydrogenase